MDSVPVTIGERFALLFDAGDDFVFLKKEALSGRLKHYEYVHFVSWQVLLGLLPSSSGDKNAIDSWEAECKRWREEYRVWRSELTVNPHLEADSDANDATLDNPLSTGESSTWAQFFADSELRKDILRDVERTYPESDYFRDPAVQEMLTMVLFVYARRHPHLVYKQGMHEICALPLFLAHRERVLRSASESYTPEPSKRDFSSLIKTLYDPEYIEHDLYALFAKIMDHLGPFYLQSRSQLPAAAITADMKEAGPNENGSALLRKCRYIQDIVLRKHDEQLSKHLNDIELEPQLYLLKWVRILFGREFHLEDTITVWDAVFAFDQNFGFIDHMAAAMLIFIRSQLLSRDFAECIKRLQKYPPVEDVTILVEYAIALTKPKPAGLIGPMAFPASSVSHTMPTTTAPAAHLITVASKPTSIASTTSTQQKPQHAVQSSTQVTATPQKPIVYASPAYNTQVQSKSSAASTETFGTTAPKRAAPNATEAQSLKATPLQTPPAGGPISRTNATTTPAAMQSRPETTLVTVPKAEWEELNRQVADSNLNRTKFTEKLNSVITGLQTALTSSTELSPQEVAELLVMTVAGLKRTRDIANGLISDDDEETGLQMMAVVAKKEQPKKLSVAPSSPAPRPPSPSRERSQEHDTNQEQTAGAHANGNSKTMDYGMLPASDTGEWGTFTPPSESTGNYQNSRPATNSAAAAQKTGPPTEIIIPASSDASKAAVSAIFD